MRTYVLIALLSLAGCSSTHTLEELEAEAIASGDWSEVEKRERVLRQQKRTPEFQCQEGYTLVCVDSGAGEECLCRTRRNNFP
ncbi:MAG: hypothetical protein OEW64_11690 [Gammaproteobacteria bacterium]|nr:hypothetical protein [Gammaproteobacteria bacterium]MDH5304741.1 hypothetical protein [Gammaproteobacteria bacterium]MDH5322754.1 hypothetical protein [Gammaproteobacteria bacterium]